MEDKNGAGHPESLTSVHLDAFRDATIGRLLSVCFDELLDLEVESRGRVELLHCYFDQVEFALLEVEARSLELVFSMEEDAASECDNQQRREDDERDERIAIKSKLIFLCIEPH